MFGVVHLIQEVRIRLGYATDMQRNRSFQCWYMVGSSGHSNGHRWCLSGFWAVLVLQGWYTVASQLGLGVYRALPALQWPVEGITNPVGIFAKQPLARHGSQSWVLGSWTRSRKCQGLFETAANQIASE